MKQLFISMLQCINSIELKYTETDPVEDLSGEKLKKKKQIWSNFVMPMILLAIRVECELLFKMNYK